MQSVSSQFNASALADVRNHSWQARISFDKSYNDDIILGEYGVSRYGEAIYAPTNDEPLQNWDKYNYANYTDRIMFMEWERSLEFPYSIVSARADFELSNTDNYFTPNSGSPISSHILSKRPVRLLSGFNDENVPQFVGLTQGMPDITQAPKRATFTALDFLTQIYEMPIRRTLAMANVRTDQVLEAIFLDFGLNQSQFSLSAGRNVIPFLFFEREQQTAGAVIRTLMEAEMGMLWLDESGIIKFRSRLEQPVSPVYVFDETNVVSLALSTDDQIINSVVFNAEVRKLAKWQNVYTKTAQEQAHVVMANDTFTFQAGLQNPCLQVEPPIAGEQSGVSWFVASDPSGETVGGVSVLGVELRTNSYDIVFANSNSFDVNISQMELYGQPGKVAYNIPDRVIDYPPSIEKHETQSIEINNNFIQSEEQMKSLALTILDGYAEYSAVIEAEVKGNPALQLGDIVLLDTEQYSGNYRIIGIRNSLNNKKYTQILTLKSYTPRDWGLYNRSTYNSSGVYAP